MGMKQILVMMAAMVLVGQSVVADEVAINNPVLREQVARFLKKPYGKFAPQPRFTKHELATVTEASFDKIAPITKITVEDLKELSKFPNLKRLNLSRTNITDEGLKEVAKFQQLTDLLLKDTQITDVGLKEVAKLQNLDVLIISNTKITDVGLKDVAKLQKLVLLTMSKNKITQACLKDVAKLQKLRSLTILDIKFPRADIAELKKALPDAVIVHGPLGVYVPQGKFFAWTAGVDQNSIDRFYLGKTTAQVLLTFGEVSKYHGDWWGYTGMNVTDRNGLKYTTVWFGFRNSIVQQVRFDK